MIHMYILTCLKLLNIKDTTFAALLILRAFFWWCFPLLYEGLLLLPFLLLWFFRVGLLWCCHCRNPFGSANPWPLLWRWRWFWRFFVLGFRIYFRQFTTCRRLSSSMHIRYVMCMCRRLSSLLYNHLAHVWHIYTSTSLMCDVNNKQQSRGAGAAGAAASRGTGCTVGVGVADVVHSTWIGCRIGHWRRFIGHWRLFIGHLRLFNWPCTGTCMDSTNIGIGCIIYTYIHIIYI